MAGRVFADTVVDSKSATKSAVVSADSDVVAVPAIGTAEWGAAVTAAQVLNHEGKYAKATKAAPLSYQAASYALNELRRLMGGKRDSEGNWQPYNVEYKTDKTQPTFAGTVDQKAACIKQIAVVRTLVEKAEAEGYADRVAYIEPYLKGYETGILR
jgi:hypothetical protein